MKIHQRFICSIFEERYETISTKRQIPQTIYFIILHIHRNSLRIIWTFFEIATQIVCAFPTNSGGSILRQLLTILSVLWLMYPKNWRKYIFDFSCLYFTFCWNEVLREFFISNSWELVSAFHFQIHRNDLCISFQIYEKLPMSCFKFLRNDGCVLFQVSKKVWYFIYFDIFTLFDFNFLWDEDNILHFYFLCWLGLKKIRESTFSNFREIVSLS